MSMMLGVPYKLMKEFTNRKITVETSNGEVYKGVLLEVEENMSMSISSVKVKFLDGKSADMENVYIKGSRVRLINLPDSATDALSSLTRQPSFRGGRGGFRGRGGRGGRRSSGGSRPSYGRR